MTTAQRRRSAAVLASIEARDAHSTQVALATPVIDPADLSDLLRADKLAAAGLLANLTERQLLVEAVACAGFFNETYGYDAGEGVSTEMMLTQLQKIAAVYRASRVDEPEQPRPYRPLLACERQTVNLPSGRLELDDRVLHAAYGLARMQRELMPSRWQNALKRGYEHLCDEPAVGVRADGAYFWWGDEGGNYTPTPATCGCDAFANGHPCRHRGAAVILSFYAEADADCNAHRYAA